MSSQRTMPALLRCSAAASESSVTTSSHSSAWLMPGTRSIHGLFAPNWKPIAGGWVVISGLSRRQYLRIPGNFPQVLIQILEIACVAAPERVAWCLYDHRTGTAACSITASTSCFDLTLWPKAILSNHAGGKRRAGARGDPGTAASRGPGSGRRGRGRRGQVSSRTFSRRKDSSTTRTSACSSSPSSRTRWTI